MYVRKREHEKSRKIRILIKKEGKGWDNEMKSNGWRLNDWEIFELRINYRGNRNSKFGACSICDIKSECVLIFDEPYNVVWSESD